MIKNPVKTLVMSEVNKQREQDAAPEDKIYDLETCANQNRDYFETYGKAWRHCAKKEEFNTTEVVRHGANPNLAPGHNMSKHEFMEATIEENKHYVPPLRTHVDVTGPKGALHLQKGIGLDIQSRNKLVQDMKNIEGIDHTTTSLKRKIFAGGFAPRHLLESSFHKDGVEFKRLRSSIGKGSAWARTLGKHEHLIKGKFYPDKKITPKDHNLYNLQENALQKVENIAGQAANNVVDVAEVPIRSTYIGEYLRKRLYVNPSKQSREQNAKEWATSLGVGTLGTQIPGLIAGDISAPVVGALAAGNALKGATIGPMLTGGKDTLLKSVIVPAGVIAVTTPLINDLGNYMDLGPDIDSMPEARVGLAGTAGAGMWALRNRKKSEKNYY